jgi:Uma2 family endonuclease
MAQRATPPPFLTVDEYLDLEEDSSIKHEYVEGALYALAGSSLRHNRIAGNIFRKLGNVAEGTTCQVYMSDVRCQFGNVFYYPDVMVACGEPLSGNQVYRSDPCLLVEVISPSTASKDRREKLLIYRQIPTVRAYLIVDQETRRVERHYRDADGVWQRADHLNDGEIPVPCPETELELDDIYRDIP